MKENSVQILKEKALNLNKNIWRSNWMPRSSNDYQPTTSSTRGPEDITA